LQDDDFPEKDDANSLHKLLLFFGIVKQITSPSLPGYYLHFSEFAKDEYFPFIH